MGFARQVFSHYQLAFSGGKEGQHPNVLVGFRRPHVRREIFLAFCTKFERTVDRVHAKYVLLKGVFMLKNAATFVQKVALIWQKNCLFLQLFRTQMYFLALNCYHWDKRDIGVYMCPRGSPNIKGVGCPSEIFMTSPKRYLPIFRQPPFDP